MAQQYQTFEELKGELERLQSNSYPTQIRREWNEAGYGNLKEKIILNLDGSRTNQLAIEKHGRVVNCMTTSYYVVPNFQIRELIKQLIERKEISATEYRPSNKRHGKWLQNEVGGVATDITDTEMVSSYIFPEKFDITGAGDFVKTGFSLRNSEAGHSALSISPFTDRNSCDNRMFHLAHEQILGFGVEINVTPNKALIEAKKNIREARANFDGVIRGFKKPHTKSLKIEIIEKALIAVRLQSQNVINRYREMYQLKIQKVQAEAIARRMPKFVLDDLAWLHVGKKKEEITFDKDVTQWDAFNDITKLLTHQGRSFRPTLDQYRKLDTILVKVK